MKPTPIELEMPMGKDINGVEHREPWKAYDIDEVDSILAEKDKEIEKLVGAKKSAEQILQNLLDCGLIKEWYFNGKFNAVLKADDPHLQIAELKQKLEDAKATAYTESVDAGMENRKLKRALYKACANWARSERYTEATWHGDEHREELWAKVQDKCFKKAEEYK